MATLDEMFDEIDKAPKKSTLDQYFDLIDAGAPVKGGGNSREPVRDPSQAGGLEAFGREALRGLSGITELEARAIYPLNYAYDTAVEAVTGNDPNARGLADRIAQDRRELAVTSEESKSLPAQAGTILGQQVAPLVTLPAGVAAIPARGLTTAAEMAPTALNAVRAMIPEMQTGVAAMTPTGGLTVQDQLDAGASIPQALASGTIATASGAFPAAVSSGLPTLAGRVLSRAAQGAVLAIPQSIVMRQANELASGKPASPFEPVEDIGGSIPQIAISAAFGGRNPAIRAALEADMPATAAALAEQDLPNAEPTTQGIPQTQEQSSQQPVAEQIAPAPEQGAEIVTEPAVTPDLAGTEAPVVQGNLDAIFDQLDSQANELPQSNPSPGVGASNLQAQQRIQNALQLVSERAPVEKQAARGSLDATAQGKQQLASVEKALPTYSYSQIKELPLQRSDTAEHEVRHDIENDQAVKLLNPDSFGMTVKFDEEGNPSIGKADFNEYLNRLRLSNEVFGTDYDLKGTVGVLDELDDERIIPRTVVTQKWHEPIDPDNPHPSSDQIAEYMERLGFKKEPRNHSWSRTDGVYISDAKPDNFILTENGVVPIDLLITQKETNAQEANNQGQESNRESDTNANQPESRSPSQGNAEEGVLTQEGVTNETSEVSPAAALQEGVVAREDEVSPQQVLEQESRNPQGEQVVTDTAEVPSQGAIVNENVLVQAQSFANRIADQVAGSEPSVKRDAAYDAAFDNARRSIESTGQFNEDYMRRSAMSAAGRRGAQEAITEPTVTPEGESIDVPVRGDLDTNADARDAAENLLGGLDSREQEILQRVVQNRESQAVVAASLGISRQRVQQIQAAALKKLQNQMQSRGFTRDDIDFDADSEWPNLGPGAANVLEFTLNPPRSTSTMNRVANAERAKRGELPVLKEAIQSNEKTFEMAESRIDQNPSLGRETVQALLEGRKNEVSEVDEAVLLYEKIRLRNERDMEADRAADPYNTEEARQAARDRWKTLEEENTQLDQATRRSGTIWGRLGQFRQRLMRDDYTFEAMERKARVSKGRPLSPEESAKIKQQADRISDLERQLEEARIRVGEKDRVKASEEATEQLLDEARKEADFDPQVETLADRIVARLTTAADKARARIKERLANASAGVDPVLLYDLSVIGAEKLAKGAVKFSRWAAEMVDEFGETVRPYLNDAWTQSQTLIDEAVDKSAPADKRPKTKARIKQTDLSGQRDYIATALKESVEDGATPQDLSSLVRRLALNFVRSGVKERDALIDAVHGVLTDFLPVSREATMDLISGYGDFKPLDKEPAKQTLRELKGEMQQIAKIADMQAGQAPKKTGVERREPSANERRLIKEVNELKRKGGFQVTDPETQLRTSLEATKTRLRNEILDYDNAIASKNPLTRKGNEVQYDAEAIALREARDQKRVEYNELFPKEPLTDAELSQRVAQNLDRSIERLQEDLKTGRLYPESKRKMTSPEIEAKKAKLAVLQSERQVLRDLDTAVIEQRQAANLRRAIDRAEADIPDAPVGRDTVDTEEVAALKTQLAAIRQRKLDEKRADSTYIEAQQEASLLRQIEQAQNKSRKTKESPYTVDTERTAKLKAQLAEIKEAEANSPEARQRKIDAAIKTTEESIAELDRRLQEGDIAPRATKEPLSSPELDALRAQRQAMQDLVRDLRAAEKPKKTREEIALQMYKTRTAARIAELQDRIARNDFAPKKRNPITLDAEGKKLEYELQQQKAKFDEERFKDTLKNRHPVKKVWDATRELLTTSRAVITSADLSAVLRQAGFVSFGNPVRALKNIPPMLKAGLSEKRRFEINKEIMERPNAELYQQSKLAITDPNSNNLNQLEEAYLSRWTKHIPLVGASERTYTTFLNLMRADTFDALLENLRKGGAVTKAETDAIANYVNVATGRGNLASATGAGVALNSLFFAPRLVLSRFELLTGQPFWRGSARTRKLIAQEYAKFLVAGYLMLYTASMATDAEVEWDPRSSDFLKIRLGNTRMDPWAGLAQATTFLSRIASGYKKTTTGKIQPIFTNEEAGVKVPYGSDDAWDVAANFVRSKLNPIWGTAVNLRTGKNVVGEKVGAKEAVLANIMPLGWPDIAEVMQEQGVPKGTALSILSLFGVGMQNFDASRKEPPRPTYGVQGQQGD